jgi:hypothetical protein
MWKGAGGEHEGGWGANTAPVRAGGLTEAGKLHVVPAVAGARCDAGQHGGESSRRGLRWGAPASGRPEESEGHHPEQEGADPEGTCTPEFFQVRSASGVRAQHDHLAVYQLDGVEGFRPRGGDQDPGVVENGGERPRGRRWGRRRGGASQGRGRTLYIHSLSPHSLSLSLSLYIHSLSPSL